MSDQTTIVFGLSLSSVAKIDLVIGGNIVLQESIGNKASGTGVSFNFERHDSLLLIYYHQAQRLSLICLI